MTHIGNNVARLRGFRLMAQKEVAAKLNISQQEYSRIEGKSQIDDEQLQRIAEVLDFPVDLIKELDNSALQNINNSGSISESIFYQNNADAKVVELYERLLSKYEKIIEEKNEVIEMYKRQQKAS